jgi:AbrB family looped-hinge helix DNA binding protein
VAFLDIGYQASYALLTMKSTISSKGQITVPAELREKLGLAPGTVVQFELREGGVLLRKGGSGPHPVDRLFGRLKLAKPVDVLLDAMRGPRPAARARSARRSPAGQA